MPQKAAAGNVEVVRVVKKELLLASRPDGLPDDSHFKLLEFDFTYTRPLQEENSVVLKVLLISIDPYLREIMNEDNGLSSIPPSQIGKPVEVLSVSKVLASSILEWKEGDYVSAITPVTNYVTIHPSVLLRKIERKGDIPLAQYLGILGMPGHTAWIGINLIGKLQPGEEMYVSSAAGAVGLVAGQLAKLKGCRVVGSAGSDEKVKKLKEVYNFNDAFNYKEEKDWVAVLRRFFPYPNEFDVYYDNVGGHMLEAALETIKNRGRIIACGMVSQYNKKPGVREGVQNVMHVVGKSLIMQGFTCFEYVETWDAFLAEVSQYVLEGKIKYETDVLGRGVEEFGKALAKLLKGENNGKAVLHISDD